MVQGSISNNLYSSAIGAGMEPGIIVEFARIFGFEVDFQRDIRKGDEFQVMYERYVDDRNKKVKTGKILYAYLNVNNQKIKLYRFGDKNNYDFFDEKGKSIRKALIDKLNKSNAEISDRVLLEELCETMEKSSLCAMGSMTPNPVRSIIKHFLK